MKSSLLVHIERHIYTHCIHIYTHTHGITHLSIHTLLLTPRKYYLHPSIHPYTSELTELIPIYTTYTYLYYLHLRRSSANWRGNHQVMVWSLYYACVYTREDKINHSLYAVLLFISGFYSTRLLFSLFNTIGINRILFAAIFLLFISGFYFLFLEMNKWKCFDAYCY